MSCLSRALVFVELPATELIAGSKISPTHSLLIVVEISSMAVTNNSTVTASAWRKNYFRCISREGRRPYCCDQYKQRQCQKPAHLRFWPGLNIDIKIYGVRFRDKSGWRGYVATVGRFTAHWYRSALWSKCHRLAVCKGGVKRRFYIETCF